MALVIFFAKIKWGENDAVFSTAQKKYKNDGSVIRLGAHCFDVDSLAKRWDWRKAIGNYLGR